jgi:CHAD domain-containing protein
VELEESSQTNASVLSIRLLSLLEKMPSSKQDVHLLRTTIRRLEVQLASLPAKLAKPLKELRKKAGKVRDIDVHLALIKPSLSRPTSPPRDPKTRDAMSIAQDKLREILKTRHDRRLDSLQDVVSEVRPLLAAKLPTFVEHAPPHAPTAREAHRQISHARERFLQLTRRVPTGAEQLHQLRIKTKKLRYSIEPLQAFKEAGELAAKFKQVQDAVGTWHDWATLTQLAQRKLPSSDADPLCAALQAHTGREYRKARRAAQSVRSWMSGKPVTPAVALALAGEPRSAIHKSIHKTIHKVG